MTDLRSRLLEFSKQVVLFVKSLEIDPLTRPLLIQFVRSATSVGANYSESQSGISRKDFRAKIYICQKEAEETKYWLELLLPTFPDKKSELTLLLDEIQQIIKILQATINKLNS